jgi:hypothetical protein
MRGTRILRRRADGEASQLLKQSVCWAEKAYRPAKLECRPQWIPRAINFSQRLNRRTSGRTWARALVESSHSNRESNPTTSVTEGAPDTLDSRGRSTSPLRLGR